VPPRLTFATGLNVWKHMPHEFHAYGNGTQAAAAASPEGVHMNSHLAIAAVVAFLVGLAHSAIGEILIFRRLRQGDFVPTNGGSLLKERHVRILWASWHVLTVFGWCIAATLLWLSLPSSSANSAGFFEQAVVVAMLVGAALVFFGTKARHPGWIGLIAVAVLVWLGRVG
jgi:hypothetical protein